MWLCEVQLLVFSQGQKKDSCQLKRWYLAIHIVENSEIISMSFQISILQDPIVICVQKCYFFNFLWYLFSKWQFSNVLGENIIKEGCYYMSIGVWVHEPRILYTYIIGVYTIEIIYDYRVYILKISIL